MAQHATWLCAVVNQQSVPPAGDRGLGLGRQLMIIKARTSGLGVENGSLRGGESSTHCDGNGHDEDMMYRGNLVKLHSEVTAEGTPRHDVGCRAYHT
jgi:hypothetical protein